MENLHLPFFIGETLLQNPGICAGVFEGVSDFALHCDTSLSNHARTLLPRSESTLGVAP